MKCIKHAAEIRTGRAEEIRRVRNEQAKLYVACFGWNYIPKEEWKAARVKAVEEKAAKKKAAEKKAADDLKELREKKQHSRRRKNQQKRKGISNG